MRILAVVVLAAGVAGAAEMAAPAGSPAPQVKKTRRWTGWLRKVGSAEVAMAERISATGIPDYREARPAEPKRARALRAAESPRAPGRT